MKIVSIEGESLHIFWTTWGISMKFSERKWLMIILKVTKKQGFTLSLESAFLEKPQSNWPPKPPSILSERYIRDIFKKYFHGEKDQKSIFFKHCCRQKSFSTLAHQYLRLIIVLQRKIIKYHILTISTTRATLKISQN